MKKQSSIKYTSFLLVVLLTVLSMILTSIAYTNQTEVHKSSLADSPYKMFTSQKQGYSFRYPALLTLTEDDDGTVTLQHQIPYENTGNCDLIGGNTLHVYLDDFKLELSLQGPIRQPKHIDGIFQTDTKEGFWIYEGIEGCGALVYYFSLNSDTTLVVRRSAIQALSGVSTYWDREEILAVPGVIPPHESNEIFREIIGSFSLEK